MRTLFFFLLILGSLAAHEFPENFYKILKEKQCLPTKTVLIVHVKEQKLELYSQGKKIKAYTISTAKNGVGGQEGSCKTPSGLHVITEKIGEGAAPYTIFEARKRKGIWRRQKKFENQDLVLTRILWLAGLEEGINKGVDSTGHVVDSYKRYIYIHSTNHEDELGHPVSKGCVRMSTSGIIDLYAHVEEGDLVWITE